MRLQDLLRSNNLGGVSRYLPMAFRFLGFKGTAIAVIGLIGYGLVSGNLGNLLSSSGLTQFGNTTERSVSQQTAATHSSGDQQLLAAYNNQQSDLQIQGSGTVKRILPDDNEGSRHQKFILQMNSGQSILVAHNIDLAPRIDSLREGERVEFYGEYEWSKQGGVIHWTHDDPAGRHAHGWLKHNGIVYQ